MNVASMLPMLPNMSGASKLPNMSGASLRAMLGELTMFAKETRDSRETATKVAILDEEIARKRTEILRKQAVETGSDIPDVSGDLIVSRASAAAKRHADDVIVATETLDRIMPAIDIVNWWLKLAHLASLPQGTEKLLGYRTALREESARHGNTNDILKQRTRVVLQMEKALDLEKDRQDAILKEDPIFARATRYADTSRARVEVLSLEIERLTLEVCTMCPDFMSPCETVCAAEFDHSGPSTMYDELLKVCDPELAAFTARLDRI